MHHVLANGGWLGVKGGSNPALFFVQNADTHCRKQAARVIERSPERLRVWPVAAYGPRPVAHKLLSVPPMKILVVEPDAATGRTLALILKEQGHTVNRLDSVDDTIYFLNGFWPDAIVMNYYLSSEETAPKLCYEIRELFGELPSTLVHSPNAEHRLNALKAPEASFLKSPFSPEELQNALDALVPVEIFLTG